MESIRNKANFGTDTDLHVGTSATAKGQPEPNKHRALPAFGLAQTLPSGASVVEAWLHLSLSALFVGSDLPGFAVYRNEQDFAEALVTWSNQPPASSVPAPVARLIQPAAAG